MSNLTHFRIIGTDVILQDYEDGKGKIILSNDDRDYNLSYYWGSMGKGNNLSKFILSTDDGYLINKLGMRDSDGDIDLKNTMKAVRRYIKDETDWKWYFSPDDDKELRNELNEIQQYSHDSRDFIDRMMRLDSSMRYSGNDYRGEYTFDDMISAISTEPWHFIVNKEPDVNIWLKHFLPKLRDYLNKNHNA